MVCPSACTVIKLRDPQQLDDLAARMGSIREHTQDLASSTTLGGLATAVRLTNDYLDKRVTAMDPERRISDV